MEFTFETLYNAKTMASMARALRKTIRKKHNRRTHVLGWAIAALALLLLLSKGLAFDFRTVVTSGAVLAVVAVLLFEDDRPGPFRKRPARQGPLRFGAVHTTEKKSGARIFAGA